MYVCVYACFAAQTRFAHEWVAPALLTHARAELAGNTHNTKKTHCCPAATGHVRTSSPCLVVCALVAEDFTNLWDYVCACLDELVAVSQVVLRICLGSVWVFLCVLALGSLALVAFLLHINICDQNDIISMFGQYILDCEMPL